MFNDSKNKNYFKNVLIIKTHNDNIKTTKQETNKSQKFGGRSNGADRKLIIIKQMEDGPMENLKT